MKKKKIACVAPEVGKKVYKYHNSSLPKEEAQAFLGHVSVCPKCEKTLRRLDWISKTIAENPEEFFTQAELGVRKIASQESPLWASALEGWYAQQKKSLKTPEKVTTKIIRTLMVNRLGRDEAGKHNDQKAVKDLAEFMLLIKHGEMSWEREKFRRPTKK